MIWKIVESRIPSTSSGSRRCDVQISSFWALTSLVIQASTSFGLSSHSPKPCMGSVVRVFIVSPIHSVRRSAGKIAAKIVGASRCITYVCRVWRLITAGLPSIKIASINCKWYYEQGTIWFAWTSHGDLMWPWNVPISISYLLSVFTVQIVLVLLILCLHYQSAYKLRTRRET